MPIDLTPLPHAAVTILLGPAGQPVQHRVPVAFATARAAGG